MTRRRLTPVLAVLLSSAALSAPGVTAQDASGANVTYEQYTFDDPTVTGIENVALVSFPFAARFAVSPKLALTLSGAFAQGSVTLADGTSGTLSGLTDTGVRASYAPVADAVVSVGLYLPTGQSSLTSEQAVVAGVIGSDLLPFRISNWGSGGGVDLSAALTRNFGPTSIGGRAGYRLVSEYTPLDDPSGAFDYDPGDQIYGRLAVDHSTASDGKLSLALTVQTFSHDAVEGLDLFASGPRVQLLGSYGFPWAGRGSAFVYGGVLHRAEGEFLPSGGGETTTTQNVLMAGVGARMRRGNVLWQPAVDGRALRTGDGLGQGYTVGLGGSAMKVGGNVEWGPTAVFRLGKLKSGSGPDTDFAGLEVGFTVRR